MKAKSLFFESHRGFTLVEVLIALLVMSVLSGMAWKGIDTMIRSKEYTEAAMERTLKLSVAAAQWEADLQAVYTTSSFPAISFDGMNLRIVRQSDKGAQVVVWSVQQGSWGRWASEFTKIRSVLQSYWQNSQMLQVNTLGFVSLVGDIQGWQIFCFRGNSWSNCQSSGDRLNDMYSATNPEKIPLALKMVLDFRSSTAEQPHQLSRSMVIPGGER